jgi:hypothetical protein
MCGVRLHAYSPALGVFSFARYTSLFVCVALYSPVLAVFFSLSTRLHGIVLVVDDQLGLHARGAARCESKLLGGRLLGKLLGCEVLL